MSDLTHILNGAFTPPSAPILASPEDQLRSAMLEAGLEPPAEIYLDGKLHRFRSGTKGKAAGDKTGWYVCYGDATPAGRFGDWRSDVEQSFRADVGRRFTAAEEMAHTRRMAEARALRDAELATKREIAGDTAQAIWEACMPAHPDHPYLKRKGIQTHGARVTGDGRLVVPLYSPDGEMASLQYIDADGGKLYHPGGATGGKFWMLGSLDEPGEVYIAEGFATAATIQQVTGRPCVVAYSASNLVPTTHAVRDLYGKTQSLTIVADRDASGVGQKYADQASAKYGARVVVPPVLGDANDYHQAGNDLAALLIPATGQAVMNKLKVVFGSDLGQEYEAPDELVEGLMTIGSLTVIYGDSNSGKTFFALALATAIAAGMPCFGRQTDPGLVVYLACEAPGSIKARMQALKKHHGLSLEDLVMVPVPLNFYEGDGDANDIIELVRAVEERTGKRVRLIIADTLARISAGANENSGEDMGPVMARFDRVAQSSKAALAIIHHNGKDAAKGARGWSGIRAHIDTEIEVEEKDGTRKAHVTKQRELPSKGETIYFRLHVIEMGVTKFGKPATTCVALPDEESQGSDHKPLTKDILEALKAYESAWWHSQAEDRDGVPYVSKSAFSDYLRTVMMASEKEIETHVKTTAGTGMIKRLLNANILAPSVHGWVMVEGPHAASLMMRR